MKKNLFKYIAVILIFTFCIFGTIKAEAAEQELQKPEASSWGGSVRLKCFFRSLTVLLVRFPIPPEYRV